MAVGERRRLADVVEERGQPNDRPRRRRRVDRRAACGPRGPRRRPCSGRCPAAPRAPAEIGASKPGVGQQPKPDRRHRRAEQLVELGGDPLAREVGDQLGRVPDPGQRLGFELEPERRRESDGADHAQRVLLEAGRRSRRPRAGGAPRRRIGRRTGRSRPGRLARSGAPGHRVDGEVAAREVELDRVAELDPVRSPEVGVVVVGPEGRDLEDLAVASDGDRPEPVLVDGAGKERDDLLGQCIGREVPVGRLSLEDDIAQRTTDDVGRVARLTRASRAGRGRPAGMAPSTAAGGPVSCDPGTGTSATPRSARRRGTA